MSPNERRVLHLIVPQRTGAIGGADLHVRDLAAAQARAGPWRPLILAPRSPQHYLRLLEDAGLLVTALPRGLRRLAILPRQHGIALIHAHGYEANYLLALMRLLTELWSGIPAVVTAHGWIETTRWLRLKSALDRICGRTAAVAFATAHRHAHRLDHPHRAATIVVHNGVEPPDPARLEQLRRDRQQIRARLDVPPESLLVGTVGRLSPEKRLDLFLHAAGSVAASVPSAHFLIVGGGQERPRLEHMASALGIPDRVAFTGLVEDTTPIYAALDVMVQPSDTEGSPRTVLEAMAHTVPVIATDVGDVPQLLNFGAAGVLIPRRDTAALCTAMRALLTDRLHADTLAATGHQHYVRHFTLEHMCRSIGAGYEIAMMAPSATPVPWKPTP
jgi:glycosyltransferase involved in cell wall biosynthesis